MSGSTYDHNTGRPTGSEHRWLAVGIVQVPNGQRAILGESVVGIAQSCECGSARIVVADVVTAAPAAVQSEDPRTD